jgi:hypothetical protein
VTGYDNQNSWKQNQNIKKEMMAKGKKWHGQRMSQFSLKKGNEPVSWADCCLSLRALLRHIRAPTPTARTLGFVPSISSAAAAPPPDSRCYFTCS